jgi:hypothetical protein
LSDNKQRLHISRAQQDKFQQARRLEQIQQFDPIEFEQFVGYLYQQMGHTVWMTISSGDEGVDLELRKGRQTTVVQCKQYSAMVHQPVARDLYEAMMRAGADRAALVTSGAISRSAEEWAQDKPLDLVDGYELLAMAHRTQAPVSRAAGKRAVPWTMIGLALLALLTVCIAGFSVTWAVRAMNERAAGQIVPPPPTAAVSDAPIAPSPTAEPTRGLSPTVTLPASGEETTTEATAVYRADPPTIDGRLDEWAGFPTITTPHITLQPAGGAQRNQIASSTWRLGWDETHFYLAVSVVDDIHVQTQTDPRLAYLGDSLELQLDTSADGRVGTQVTANSWQFVISPGDFAAISPSVYRFRGNAAGNIADAPGHQARVAAVQTNVGYDVEVAIPWSDVAFTPAAEARLRAALSVNDNDSPGTAVQNLMLSNVATRQWRNPSSWGFLRLSP